MQLGPCSLSLVTCFGEASFHVIRTLWQGTEVSRHQPAVSEFGGGSSSPSQAFRWLQLWSVPWLQSHERLWARPLRSATLGSLTHRNSEITNVFCWFFFSFLKIYLYLWLCWVFVSVRGLFSSCGKWGPLFIAVRGPLTIMACLVAEHRLQTRRLSSCGSRA